MTLVRKFVNQIFSISILMIEWYLKMRVRMQQIIKFKPSMPDVFLSMRKSKYYHFILSLFLV